MGISGSAWEIISPDEAEINFCFFAGGSISSSTFLFDPTCVCLIIKIYIVIYFWPVTKSNQMQSIPNFPTYGFRRISIIHLDLRHSTIHATWLKVSQVFSFRIDYKKRMTKTCFIFNRSCCTDLDVSYI